MSMEELEALKKAFDEAQNETKHNTMIPERTCIEILFKLRDLQKVQLISLNNGSGFITSLQLENEIHSALKYAGGRISLNELSNIISISVTSLELKINELIKREKKRLFIIQNDLIRFSYFDTICEEINELLQESGQLFITDLVERFALPVDTLKDEIAARIPSIISGVLNQTNLTTSEFNSRISSIIRGTLIAATRPVSINLINTNFKLDQNAVLSTIQQSLKEYNISGKIQNGHFYPRYYIELQMSILESFFRDNKFICFHKFHDGDGYSIKQYLTTRHPSGVLFTNFFFKRDLLNYLHQLLEETLRSNSWLDISPYIPLAMEIFDIQELFEHLQGFSKNYINSLFIPESISFISEGFLIKISSLITPLLENDLFSYFSSEKLTNTTTSSKQLTQESNFKKGSTKRKSKEKVIKKEDKKTFKKYCHEQEDNLTVDIDSVIKNFLDINDGYQSSLEDLCSDLNETNQIQLRLYLIPKFRNLYHSIKSKCQQPLSNLMKLKYQETSNLLAHNLDVFQLHLRAYEDILSVLNEVENQIMLKYLISFAFVEIFDPLLSLAYFDKNKEDITVSVKNRLPTLEMLVQEDSALQPIKNLYDSLILKDVKLVINLFSSAYSTCGLMVKPLIKKKQKELFSNIKSSWQASLSKCIAVEPQILLYSYIVFQLLQKCNIYIYIPRENFSVSILNTIFNSYASNFESLESTLIHSMLKDVLEMEKLTNSKIETKAESLIQSYKVSLEVKATHLIDEFIKDKYIQI